MAPFLRFPFSSPSRLTLGVILLSALFLTCSLEASCGYYVKVRNQANVEQPPMLDHVPAAPCDGPACQRNTPLPSPPLAPPLNWETSDDGIGSIYSRILFSSDASWAVACRLILPSALPSRIDRPPQVVV